MGDSTQTSIVSRREDLVRLDVATPDAPNRFIVADFLNHFQRSVLAGIWPKWPIAQPVAPWQRTEEIAIILTLALFTVARTKSAAQSLPVNPKPGSRSSYRFASV